MRGSVVKRGKTYSVVLDVGRDPQTGKRRQKWHSGYRTKREAEAALAELVGNVNRGTYVERTRQTLNEFVDDWLTAIEPTVRPATHYSYARNLRLHVLPYLGSVPLVVLDGGALNGLYARLLAEGRKDHESGGLSPRSVRYVHTILHRVCRDAVKWGRLSRNPSDTADPPRATSSGRPEMTTWTSAELRAFLDRTRADRLHAAWLLLATTGMRRGEALGLRWVDLDLDAGRAAVRQTVIAVQHEVVMGTPKTAKGRRTVMLDAVTVAALREHRKRRARSDCSSVAAGATSTWCSAASTEHRCTRSGSLDPSPTVCGSSVCRRSGCTIFATGGRRWRSRRGCIRRWSRSGWDTRTSRSRWTRTRTSPPGCTGTPRRRSPASSSELVSSLLAAGPHPNQEAPLTCTF